MQSLAYHESDAFVLAIVAVLAVGAIVTIATLFVQLRALPRAFAALRGPSEDARASRSLLGARLAAAAGMGSISGAVLAVELGGPGALPWMWIATALAMAVQFADDALAPGSGPWPLRGGGGSARALGWLMAIGALATAATAGALLQSHELAALVTSASDVSAIAVMIVLLLVAAAVVLGRRGLLLAAALAMVGWTVAALAIAFEDPLVANLALGDAINSAFGIAPAAGGAAGGVVAAAMSHGLLRATLAGHAGLGAGAWSEGGPSDPVRRGAVAMLAPLLVTATVATSSALVVLTAPSELEPIMAREPLPLERPHSRGLRPSQQVGQTVVLPQDTTLEAQKHYAMRLRLNPRGHALAKLQVEQNAVILPNWGIAAEVDTIILRSRDKRLEKQPQWDVRIAAERKLITGRAGELVELKPKDPELVLSKLIAKLELSSQPYVDVGDFPFVGRVAKAMSPDAALGEHLAMFEAAATDRPDDPKLHEFFRNGYRGPYADDGAERPPFGFLQSDALTAQLGDGVEPGDVLHLRLPADPRGDTLVRLNRVGGVEGPPWDFLVRATELVVRNDGDPAKDIVVPVRAELDGWRVRFTADDQAWQDFRKVASMPGHSGPYVRVEDFAFDVEVHDAARLGPDHAGKLVLVPLHALGEPQGPYGELPYAPHPAEVLAAGMRGPVIAREGAAILGARLRAEGGWARTVALGSAFVLALLSLVAWSDRGAVAAGALLGSGTRTAARIGLFAIAAAGLALPLETLVRTVDLAIAAAAVPTLGALLMALGRVRRLGRGEKSSESA